MIIMTLENHLVDGSQMMVFRFVAGAISNKHVGGSICQTAKRTRQIKTCQIKHLMLISNPIKLGSVSSISNVTEEGGVNGRRLRDGSKRVDRDGGF